MSFLQKFEDIYREKKAALEGKYELSLQVCAQLTFILILTKQMHKYSPASFVINIADSFVLYRSISEQTQLRKFIFCVN